MHAKYPLLQLLHSIAPYLAIALVCVLSLRFAWTGFVASDDEYYVAAGIGWLEQFPYVAQHFGTVRASIAIPIAFMIYLFGENEFTVTLSTMLFLVGCVGITIFMLGNLVGRSVALLAGALLVTTPIFALKATTPCADIPELFFVIVSFWLFWQACWSEKRILLLLFSGIFGGLAFSAHELSSALFIFYGFLFLRSFKIKRNEYLWIALGFFLVLMTEGVYYLITVGNPAHRFMLLLQGVSSSHDRVQVDFLQIASGGALHIWAPIDPLVMLFTHHNFSILGWISIPAIWWLIVSQRENQSKTIILARLALALGATWLVFNTIMLREIVVLPRYYMVTAYCLLVVIVVWISNEFWLKRQNTLVIVLIGTLVINLIFISIDNKNPKFAEKALVAYLKQSQGKVYTDPLTAEDAIWYCRWEGVDCNRIVSLAPSPKERYFWNPKNTNKPNRLVAKTELGNYQPKQSWENILTIAEDTRPIAKIFMFSGFYKFIPEKIAARIFSPNPDVHIYTVN